jgi:peptidoglycan/LPS O-acetylase OafA/YrhL
MISHSAVAFFGRPDPIGALFKNISLGDIGVVIFFGLSGYLISGSLLRGGEGFALRRAARILPGLSGCVIFCAILAAFFVPSLRVDFTTANLYAFLTNALIFPFVPVPSPSVCNTSYGCNMIGPFWTLCYEVTCYTSLALLFKFFRGNMKMVSVVVVVFAVIVHLDTFIVMNHILKFEAFGFSFFHMDLGSLSWLIGIFYVGVFLRLDEGRALLNIRIAIAMLALFLWASRESRIEGELAAIVAVPIATITFGQIPSAANRLLISHVGDISYGVYVYHFPIQVIIWSVMYPVFGGWSVLIAYASTYLMAYLSFHNIESPFIEAAKGRRSVEAGATAAR